MVSNVHEVASAFVGRAAELAAIAARFDDGARIVTVVAPGGMGKTRAAMRFAALHADAFAAHGGGGAWFCDLTDASDLSAACSVIAKAVGVTLPPSRDGHAMLALFGRELALMKRVLCVLDNAEHLVAEVAQALSVWTTLAEQARFLVTSRTTLNVAGEHLVLLEPLALPEPDADRDALLATEAVELFTRRVREVRPNFDPALSELAALADVVRATDGIPLAIELAAAKARVLSLLQMRSRLAEPLELLTRRDDSGKHASMRRAILDSIDQLAPAERRFWAACSVFHGGFTLEAAEEVLQAPGLSVLSALDSLVARSLVRVRESEGEMRFSLFETIREAAAQTLASQADDAAITNARHATYFARCGAELLFDLETNGDKAARAKLDRELGNSLSAFEHYVASATQDGPAALSLALALEPVLFQRGRFELARTLLERAAAIDPSVAARARVVVARAMACHELGETELARTDFELAIELAANEGDVLLEALASVRLGELVELRGDTASARELFARGLACLERAPASRLRRVREAELHARLGHVARREGRIDVAEHEAKRALALYRDADCEEELARALYEAGVLALFREHHAEALARFEEGLTLARRLGQRPAEASLLCGRGIVLQEQGELAQALAEHARAVRIYHETGSRHREGSALYYLGGTFLEQRSTLAASKLLSQSFEIVEQASMRRYESLVAGARAVAAADDGDFASARSWLAVARRAADACQSEPTLGATVSIHEATVAFAEAPGAASDALVSDARAQVARDSNDDVRFALRLLLARARASPPAHGDVWAVASDGSAFRAPGLEARVDLSRRAPLRRILVALAELRVEAPGESLSMYEIVRAGWPNERVGQASAANRVRVALATLRKLGLRDAIVTGRGGYLLDPAAAVAIVESVDR